MDLFPSTVRYHIRKYPATIGLATIILAWFGVYNLLFARVVGAADVDALKTAVAVNPNAPLVARTYVTALFSHASAKHALMNAVGIAVGGFLLERRWGSNSVLVVFFGAGLLSICGYVVSCSVIANCGYGIGASGGVYGLYGATIALVMATRPRNFQTIVAIECLIAVSKDVLVVLSPEQHGSAIASGVHLTGAVVGAAIVVAKQITRSRLKSTLKRPLE